MSDLLKVYLPVMGITQEGRSDIVTFLPEKCVDDFQLEQLLVYNPDKCFNARFDILDGYHCITAFGGTIRKPYKVMYALEVREYSEEYNPLTFHDTSKKISNYIGKILVTDDGREIEVEPIRKEDIEIIESNFNFSLL